MIVVFQACAQFFLISNPTGVPHLTRWGWELYPASFSRPVEGDDVKYWYETEKASSRCIQNTISCSLGNKVLERNTKRRRYVQMQGKEDAGQAELDLS